jgi:hypothetical protein
MRQFGSSSGSRIVDWAVDALVAGWDSPSLRVLAGLEKPPNEFEVDRYVTQVAQELRIDIPNRRGLGELYALVIARDLVDGAAPPYEGSRELRRLWLVLGCPTSLQPWSMYEDGFELARDGIYGSVGDVERDIINEAKRMLAAAACP